MKTIFGSLLILAFLSVSFSTIAQELEGTNFEDLTLEEALEKASIEGKRVFVDCYTLSCRPCIFIIEHIFPKKEVGDYFNKYFISLKKNMTEGEGIEIREKYNIMILPTFLIFEPDGNLLCKLEGGSVRNKDDDFVEMFKERIKPYELRSAEKQENKN